jgi:hypothetical protein
MYQPISIVVSRGEFVFDQFETMGEEEGEGGDDGEGALVEAAGLVAGYVEDGFGGCHCGDFMF